LAISFESSASGTLGERDIKSNLKARGDGRHLLRFFRHGVDLAFLPLFAGGLRKLPVAARGFPLLSLARGFGAFVSSDISRKPNRAD